MLIFLLLKEVQENYMEHVDVKLIGTNGYELWHIGIGNIFLINFVKEKVEEGCMREIGFLVTKYNFLFFKLVSKLVTKISY